LEGYNGKTKLILENSAGAGEIIGDDLSELSQIIKGVNSKSIAGICLDTQHSFASGYDWRKFNVRAIHELPLLKKIDQEIPFAVIHMSAISGSGIEPSEIFKIIGLSKEYPNLRKEIRKVMNQINLYGYDLVTALNNAARSSPSEKVSELFTGLATSISSGANLSEFFEKRSESLLLSYRLEREKYTKTAETFMDIYISVVIAAPMILMLLLVMIGVSGIEVGFSTTGMTFLIILVLSFVNVLFIGFLHLKQPTY
jgi:flagellar protein FlaJ